MTVYQMLINIVNLTCEFAGEEISLNQQLFIMMFTKIGHYDMLQ